MMKTPFFLFASTRYWVDRALLEKTVQAIKERLSPLSDDVRLIVDGNMEGQPDKLETAVIVPLSGAVQRNVLELSKRCGLIVMYAGYCTGNFDDAVVGQLLYYNAAPTLMDTWAVINREQKHAFLAVTEAELSDVLRAVHASGKIRGEKLVIIGDAEPWVVSNAKQLSSYEEKLGITIEYVSPDEIIRQFQETTVEEALPMLNHYADHAQQIIESTDEDMVNASRFGTALVNLLREHNACGGAIACFDLIGRTGINACLGVSYVNDMTDMFIACEGDMDSAVTMLLMRGITDDKLWMANPCLDASGRVNFSHCTAPWHIGGRECPYALRHHHESGIGVSLQVTFPSGCPLTMCRISKECSAISIHTGQIVSGKRLNVCRTQMWVQLDEYEHYLRTALGCHQVFAFENVKKRMEILALLLDLKIV